MNRFTARNHWNHILVAIAVLIVVSWAGISQAGPITANSVPTITVDAEGFAGPAWEFSPALDVLEDLPGRGKKLGVPRAIENILGNRAAVEIRDLEFDPDPFVVNDILITNTSGMDETFTVIVALPTVFAAPNLISGSILLGVNDASGDGSATVATDSGQPIYAAQIDGATVASLLDDPFSLSTDSIDTTGVVPFGPAASNVAVTSDIGIELHFSLSPGDTATILSRFEVAVIPEPASFALGIVALSALIGLTCRRR